MNKKILHTHSTEAIGTLASIILKGIEGSVNPLAAALPFITAYNKKTPLEAKELSDLYTCLTAQLSESKNQTLAQQWKAQHENFALYAFRAACGLKPCPQEIAFEEYAKTTNWDLNQLFSSLKNLNLQPIDLSLTSDLLGNIEDKYFYTDFEEKMAMRHAQQPEVVWFGGYNEVRKIYTTDAYKRLSNEGFEYRSIHLGVDFWTTAETPIYAIEDGEVFGAINNAADKDYGPTIILKHTPSKDVLFYTLYGHLSCKSLVGVQKGQIVKKGQRIGWLGTALENGNWSPHLHFQIILDMLGLTTDFYGVAAPSEQVVFNSICPNPTILFDALADFE